MVQDALPLSSPAPVAKATVAAAKATQKGGRVVKKVLKKRPAALAKAANIDAKRTTRLPLFRAKLIVVSLLDTAPKGAIKATLLGAMVADMGAYKAMIRFASPSSAIAVGVVQPSPVSLMITPTPMKRAIAVAAQHQMQLYELFPDLRFEPGYYKVAKRPRRASTFTLGKFAKRIARWISARAQPCAQAIAAAPASQR